MLSKSKIDYLTHSWNFYPGCNHTLEVCPCADKCWAKSMAHRYGQPFEPHLIPEKLLDPLKLKKPARIGVCFTGDLFGDWVDPDEKMVGNEMYEVWLGSQNKDRAKIKMGSTLKEIVFKACELRPQHQFLFLTKRPENLIKWGRFPDNALVGATVCNAKMFHAAMRTLPFLEAKNKYISFEPLMSPLGIDPRLLSELLKVSVNWLVIGGWSGGKNPPQISWVREIVDAADKAEIPVFLKDNLWSVLGDGKNPIPNWAQMKYSENVYVLRQEYPVSIKNEIGR
jgi:protein gp37